jgi:hypothetical protein
MGDNAEFKTEWVRVPYRLREPGQEFSHRRARQMSRDFADVGIGIPAARLRDIAAGAPVASDEFTDLSFALAASEIKHQQHQARTRHNRSLGVQGLVVTVATLASMGALVCVFYVFLLAVERGY